MDIHIMEKDLYQESSRESSYNEKYIIVNDK
jgi:hypothetical protein